MNDRFFRNALFITMKWQQIVTTRKESTVASVVYERQHMGPDRLQGGVALGWMPVAAAPKDYYYFYYYH